MDLLPPSVLSILAGSGSSTARSASRSVVVERFEDTGGVVEGSRDNLTRRVSEEALKAVETADIIVFVVDARVGLTGSDEHVGGLLRASGRPVIPVANKVDSRGQEGLEFDLYRLGLGEVVAVSAEQGRGTAVAEVSRDIFSTLAGNVYE